MIYLQTKKTVSKNQLIQWKQVINQGKFKSIFSLLIFLVITKSWQEVNSVGVVSIRLNL